MPYPFSDRDLEDGRMLAGARRTIAEFRDWQRREPGAIAEHIDRYTAHVAGWSPPQGFASRLRRRARRGGRAVADRERIAREVRHFVIYNTQDVPSEELIAEVVDLIAEHAPSLRSLERSIRAEGAHALTQAFLPLIPEPLRDIPEVAWLRDRLRHLQRILPADVLRAGALGKVARTIGGVLAIAAYDLADADRGEARHRLPRVIRGAYALAAAYVIIDDCFHDLPGDRLSRADREAYHRLVVRGLHAGHPIAWAELPDNPLAEELRAVHARLLVDFPPSAYPHLYQAALCMYHAQYRDAFRSHQDRGPAFLPDMLIKSGLSRAVANIIARRSLPAGFYARCVNTILISQIRDDLKDREEDRASGRPTLFTVTSGGEDNPLYDMFAYDAYIAANVFGGLDVVADTLAGNGAASLANHLTSDPGRADALRRSYPLTPELAGFLDAVSRLGPEGARRRLSVDQRLRAEVNAVTRTRPAHEVDCRTYAFDQLPFIAAAIDRHISGGTRGGVHDVIAYCMSAPGKRVRPVLSLALADALGMDRRTLEPMIVAEELFHTASLMFDDLPAQDDATMRRGRPAAHTVFPESSVQLAGIAMISTGFGLVSRLSEDFPAARVAAVVDYVGSYLGPEGICRGQLLDLSMARSMARGERGPAVEELLEMYALKTSTALEAGLVPLLMLAGRPGGETRRMKRYARHAGIVFQIRDDILDQTSTAGVLGKDARQDSGRATLVTVHGLAEAQRIMTAHLGLAGEALDGFGFDTRLLRAMTAYFAARRR